MTIEYFDFCKQFYLPNIEGAAPAAAREAIIEVFSKCGVDVGPGEVPADSPAHTLVAWAYDEDMTIHVFAVPDGALSEGLHAAFARVPSMGYAYDEIMGGSDVCLELMRIDAAMDADYEDLLEDFAYDMDPDVESKIAQSDRACMEPFRIATIESGEEPVVVEGGFDKRFTATARYRRSQ